MYRQQRKLSRLVNSLLRAFDSFGLSHIQSSKVRVKIMSQPHHNIDNLLDPAGRIKDPQMTASQENEAVKDPLNLYAIFSY